MAIPLILDRPVVVSQTAQMTCWAAAFNSWAQVTGLRGAPNEAGLVQLFSGVQNALFADNSASERGIRIINQFGFMNSRAISGARLTPQLLERLLQVGHIYLAYTPLSNNVSNGHVVVVYGVEAQQVRVMNPDPRIGISTLPFSFLLSRRRSIVGVPNGIVRAYSSPNRSAFGGMTGRPAARSPRSSDTPIPGFDF